MPKAQLGRYYRVVVTGDRNWPDEGWFTVKSRLIALRVDQYPNKPLKDVWIITGGARGVDTQADLVATILDYKTTTVIADWKRYGKSAGPIRNIEMLERYKPDLVIAFHNNIKDSKGTAHCVQAAEKRNIPVEIISQL